MYRVLYLQDQWLVFDASETVVFAGTKQQAEDWLDHQENIQRSTSSETSLRRLCHSLSQMIADLVIRLTGRLTGERRRTTPQIAEREAALAVRQD